MQMKATWYKRLDLSISGMHCAGCVARIEKALAQANGVKEARVNLATETAFTFSLNLTQYKTFFTSKYILFPIDFKTS